MADNSRSLAKLVIHSFAKNDFKTEDKSKLFSTPINPETFSRQFKVELDAQRGHGKANTNPQYKSTAPQDLKIEFVLDGTKTLEGYTDEYKKLSVHDQIVKLLACVYDVIPETHRPPYLNVQWGSEIDFNCVLQTLDINYTLFNPDGSPLRAKVNASFISYVAPQVSSKATPTHSPDLTHYKKIKQGDRLDIMAYETYNDPNYFLQVAKINGLSSPRNIKAGIEIYLPPLDKTDKITA